MSPDEAQKFVLSTYTRAVVHLRRQFESKRFGLVLGAGVSRSFKVPLWKNLVDSIAKDPDVDGVHLIDGHSHDAALPYKTELLLRHFIKRHTAAAGGGVPSREQENSVYARWLRICARHLYADAPPDVDVVVKSHPYLQTLIPLIQNSHTTVSLNFDDYLEYALNKSKRPADKGTRGYEMVTNPWTQFRRQDSVIYHLHGVIPRASLMELPTDRFVFSEGSYAKQYVGPAEYDSSFLLSHFSRHTCLFLGCSLEDAIRTVLMRCAYVSPGNFHYYVQFIEDGKSLSGAEMSTISDTNFHVYNLITLFLTGGQIAALLKLISKEGVSDGELRDLAASCRVPLKYHFYLTGPLGVGKSTTSSLFRNLLVLDEWLEQRPEVLGKSWDLLSDTEREEADNWLDGQFRAKNDTLRHDDNAGLIALVDRPPLDPLAFANKTERPARAKTLLDALCPGRTWMVVDGTVILLTGDEGELSARLKATGRDDYTPPKLKQMQDDLLEIYTMPGVEKIDTRGRSVVEVTRQIAEIIHRRDYKPCNLTEALQKLSSEVK